MREGTGALMAIRPLDDFKTYPRMVRWFNPLLLIKLLNNVVTSGMFGQYADRRLIVAALDTVDTKIHEKRARSLRDDGTLAQEGAVWFDFVADLGDGFDSTYAVATLLARESLTVDKEELPRGQFLLMGGDEVYPVANKQTYANQLKQPYKWAFPDHNRKSDKGVPIFAIPGNHDWYDGLVLFLAYFCREKPSHFGSWRSRQRRSYFAIQLTETWWIWAIDIQLAEDMDQPQADYFEQIAKVMGDNSRIILCSAEPGWLYTDTNTASWSIMDFAIGIAQKAGRNFAVPILLSGDTHHYSRYATEDGTQFITSGGGGAFLHPTHQLEQSADIRWCGTKRTLSLGKKAGTEEAAVYPSMKVSRKLIWGNLRFAFKNWDFSILMGIIYFVIGVAAGLRDEWDTYAIVAFMLGLGIVSYTTDQEKVSLLESLKERLRLDQFPSTNTEVQKAQVKKTDIQLRKAVTVVAASLFHTAAHVAAVLVAAHFFAQMNTQNFTLTGQWWYVWKWLGLLLVEMGVVGFLIGSTIFGLNMLITGLCFRMSRNDSFSALRIGHYNNFLRIRIDGDAVEIYAIGLENVPDRDDWIDNPKMKEPGQPHFIPAEGKELKHHLIEKVVVSGPYRSA